MKNENLRTFLLAAFLSALALVPAASGAGTFAATGSLKIGRHSHTATLLPNGKVLVVGGFIPRQDSTGIPQSSAELFDPATGTWTRTGSPITARAGHTATLLPNGKVLATSGIYGGGDSAELYDPAAGTWTLTGSLKTPRNGSHTATLLPNGKVLVAGGLHIIFADSTLKSAELYDPTTGTWTATGSLKEARSNHTATLLPNGKVLVAGGDVGSGFQLNGAELYDSATGTWTPTGSLNAGRFRHSATQLPSGQVLLAGGYGEINGVFSLLLDTELYDPATGIWTNTGRLNAIHGSPTATLLPNGKVLIAGGYGNTGNDLVAAAQLYDPSMGTWMLTGRLNVGRGGHTATLLPDGKVLFAAGRRSGSTTFTSAELFSESDLLPFSISPGPVTAPKRLPDLNSRFSYTNVGGLPFTAVATDDLSTPADNWTFVGVGIETAPGQYQFTDPDAAGHPHRFYQVKSP